MPQHVFFSWQSDTPNRLGRNFVESCLERAIGELQADAEVDLADREIQIDRLRCGHERLGWFWSMSRIIRRAGRRYPR